jgi:tRNA threonylcarbamoyladenosine biosynthesis protein TsaE
METITQSAQETKDLGQKFSASLKGGETIALVGDLGAGKTTFVQGLAQGLGIKNRMISPTFILIRNYDDFFHVDLYRLEENVDEEVKNLGLTDIWGKNGNIVVIEWAEKITDLLPENTIWINLEILEGEQRKIAIKQNGG